MHTIPLYDEKELLARLVKGDKKAFQSIFDIFWKALFLYAFNVLKNKEASEDIVQEIFSQVWQNHEVMQINTSLKGYLFSATHYRVLKELRFNRNIVLDTSNLEEKLKDESPEAILTLKDLQEQINFAIELLPEKCKEIYLLSRECQYSHKEIANKLDLSTKTVEAQITIALRRIRRQLGYNSMLKIFFPFL